jgi:hypothetical protein
MKVFESLSLIHVHSHTVLSDVDDFMNNDLYCSTDTEINSNMPTSMLATLQLEKVKWEVMLIYAANTEVVN